MKLSLKWLNDHVDVSEFFSKPNVLADRLTDAGLEVEEVSSQAEALKKVVVGKIEKLEKHPDADKLTYCEVNVGESENLKIVCGAKNHKEGDKVCVAQVGAVLPGDFKIKKSKIRGLESFGMLCSLSELGLSDEKSDGILILDKEAPVGESFAKYFGADDVTFEINVTPNRADCLSHLGLAREVATLFSKDLKDKASPSFEQTDDRPSYRIDLKDPELCPRYMGHMVYGVNVGPSPSWLVEKLESVGMNSINNIVDITNYIMMDSGQPLHAFDADLLSGDTVVIAKATPGEAFKSLDGTDYKLSGEELTIRDQKGPVALAGVVGGENSGVSEKTKNIFIEAAHFIPSSVRKTSRALGIDTDSGYRFSRGTDESNVANCLGEAVAMVLEIAGGSPNKNYVESYPNKKIIKNIEVELEYISQRMGFELSKSDVEGCFSSLGFEFSSTPKGWSVKPASYRWDIEIKEDLVEEVGRILGYDKIPEALPNTSSGPQNENSNYQNFKVVRQQLTALGFHEAVHYNFYSGVEEAKWGRELSKGISQRGETVEIQNPLSSDLSQMRTSLIPQFVSNYIRNWRLGSKSGRIFELGKAHFKDEQNYFEKEVLCAALWVANQSPSETMETTLEVLSEFFEKWGVSRWKADPVQNSSSSVLHPGFDANLVVEGKSVGRVYSLHPAVSKDAKVPANFCGFEIDLGQFLKGKPRPVKFKDFSRHPIVERDFSILVSKTFSFDEVLKKVKKTASDTFMSLDVHDTYRSDEMPEDMLSVTFRGRFQAKDRTLSDEELKSMQKKILAELGSL